MAIYTEGFFEKSCDAETKLVDLVSTEEEKKKVLSVFISAVTTEEVYLNVTLERESLIDRMPMPIDAFSEPVWEISVDVEIPVGQTLKVLGLSTNAGTAGIVSGYIQYEIIG